MKDNSIILTGNACFGFRHFKEGRTFSWRKVLAEELFESKACGLMCRSEQNAPVLFVRKAIQPASLGVHLCLQICGGVEGIHLFSKQHCIMTGQAPARYVCSLVVCISHPHGKGVFARACDRPCVRISVFVPARSRLCADVEGECVQFFCRSFFDGGPKHVEDEFACVLRKDSALLCVASVEYIAVFVFYSFYEGARTINSPARERGVCCRKFADGKTVSQSAECEREVVVSLVERKMQGSQRLCAFLCSEHLQYFYCGNVQALRQCLSDGHLAFIYLLVI